MTLSQALTLISPAAGHVTPTGQAAPGTPQTWADLGCGSGLFTQALAQILPTGSTIYGIDTNPTLRRQEKPTSIIPIEGDFITDPLDLPPLDGILMANSLHYVKDKPALIKKLRDLMHPDSLFLIVEYDMDEPVPTWVPYPVSYNALFGLFGNIQKLGQRPSVFGRANIYAALVQAK